MPFEITSLSKSYCLDRIRGIFPEGTDSIKAVVVMMRALSVIKRNRKVQIMGMSIMRSPAKTYNLVLEKMDLTGICATETPSTSMERKVVERPI